MTPQGDAERVARRAEIVKQLRRGTPCHNALANSVRCENGNECTSCRIRLAAADYIETELSRLQAALAAREGYVLVPVEPTREMWAAGANAVVGKTTIHHDIVVGDCWFAMIAARPTPADSGEGK